MSDCDPEDIFFCLSLTALMMSYLDVLYNQCISNMWKSSISIFPTGRIRVCEIRCTSTGITCGNPYPVCKKLIYGTKYSHKMWHRTACKNQLISRSWNIMIFDCVSELLLPTLIQRYDKNYFILGPVQKRETNWNFTGSQMPLFYNRSYTIFTSNKSFLKQKKQKTKNKCLFLRNMEPLRRLDTPGGYSAILAYAIHELRKETYSNILKIISPKKKNFRQKNLIFSYFCSNIDCEYSLEPHRRF